MLTEEKREEAMRLMREAHAQMSQEAVSAHAQQLGLMLLNYQDACTAYEGDCEATTKFIGLCRVMAAQIQQKQAAGRKREARADLAELVATLNEIDLPPVERMPSLSVGTFACTNNDEVFHG